MSLYIGGVGIARGYLNNPKLTNERFIPNPFQSDTEKRENRNARIYKTGDLVRWLPNGELEYIGRNDFQVKIRGFRIELGEIESVLSEYKGVKQVAVLAKENKETNNKYLVAYYTSDKGNKLGEDDILSHIATKLPDYMIPTAIVHMNKLPLTLNGKLDRKALPDPILGSIENYVPPRNELESRLCNIFADVLGLDVTKVGISGDFFKLGGDSISAIKLVNRINQFFKASIKIIDIFLYKNILSIVDKISKTKQQYHALVKLNNTYHKSNMFMIHPGGAGCEPYISLANNLNKDFSCYGIDSYNLYFRKKIDSLKQLSQYYLSHIEEVMKKTNQNDFHILGWSLGGQIALEIASIPRRKRN